MKQKFLAKDNFKIFVEALAGTYDVYHVEKDIKGSLHLARFSGDAGRIVIGGVRPFEPLKNFFFMPREKVVDGYKKSGETGQTGRDKRRPFCIMGVKNCDLIGMDTQDFVFLGGDFKDPFYVKNRESNLIIGADCTYAIDTCFCRSLGIEHYPQKHYDMSISELRGGYLVEGRTERGSKFLERHSGVFGEADARHIEERDHIRKHTGEQVDENIRKHNIPYCSEFGGIIKANLESPIWETEVKTCVECGCCNVVCPTCHCFYLADSVVNGNKEARHKMWDACMYKRFARVAGGANARPHLWMRLRNRFEKKFDFFPDAAGFYACTGCGRCFSGCPAKIDIRRILKNLVAEKKAKV